MESHYSLLAKHILKSQFPHKTLGWDKCPSKCPQTLSQKTTCRRKVTVSLTPPKGLEKGRTQECWLGGKRNHRLAGLYNVQFATINTQVPGLLNRNLGGAW